MYCVVVTGSVLFHTPVAADCRAVVYNAATSYVLYTLQDRLDANQNSATTRAAWGCSGLQNKRNTEIMFVCDSRLPSFAPGGVPSRGSHNQITAGQPAMRRTDPGIWQPTWSHGGSHVKRVWRRLRLRALRTLKLGSTVLAHACSLAHHQRSHVHKPLNSAYVQAVAPKSTRYGGGETSRMRIPPDRQTPAWTASDESVGLYGHPRQPLLDAACSLQHAARQALLAAPPRQVLVGWLHVFINEVLRLVCLT